MVLEQQGTENTACVWFALESGLWCTSTGPRGAQRISAQPHRDGKSTERFSISQKQREISADAGQRCKRLKTPSWSGCRKLRAEP